MEYTLFGKDAQIKSVANRLFQLEQELFGNRMLIEEAELIGDTETNDNCKREIAGLLPRVEHLRKRLEELQNVPEPMDADSD